MSDNLARAVVCEMEHECVSCGQLTPFGINFDGWGFECNITLCPKCFADLASEYKSIVGLIN